MYQSKTNLPRRIFLKRLAALSGLVITSSWLAACGENAVATPALANTTAAPVPSTAPATPTAPTSTIAAPTTAAPSVATPTSAATVTPPAKATALAPAGFTALGSLATFKEAATVPVGFKTGNIAGFVFLKNGSYLAYSNICTHQGCEVAYNAGQGNLACPCHGSRFSKEGTVMAGPARLNLADFNTQVVGEILYGKLK